MVIPLDAVVADLAMDCPQWPVDAALHTIFLVHVESLSAHHVFMLGKVHMVLRGNKGVLFLPLVLVHYLDNYAGVGIDAAEEHGEGEEVEEHEGRDEDLGVE